MQISFDTATIQPQELDALAALIASLGGRLPAATQVVNISGATDEGTLRSFMRGATSPVIHADESGHFPSLEDDVPPPPTESTEGKAGPIGTQDAGVTGATSAGTTTSTANAGIELDADGIPWDERIHASTKTKTQAGVWTKKRKVDEVLYGQVHAELQEQYATEGNADVPPPPATQDTGQSSNASATTAENAPTDDTDVPPPPAQDVPAASETGGFSEFPELVQAVSGFGLPYVKLAELAGTVSDGKIVKFPDLRGHPELWDDFFALAQSAA